MPAGRFSEQGRQLFEAAQIVNRQEIVDMGQNGPNPSRYGLVAGRPEKGVEPDDPAGRTSQAGHFVFEQAALAAVPAVGKHDNPGPATQQTPRPFEVEKFEGFTDPSTATPIGNTGDGRFQGDIDIAALDFAGDPRESGAKTKTSSRLVALLRV